MSFKIQPPTELPQDMLDQYRFVEKGFIEALQTLNPAVFEKSFKDWDKLHKEILISQPQSTRFHKGGELHNMAICKIYTHQTVDSLKFFLMAYIEDILSVPQESASTAPAAITLRDIFKLSDTDFKIIQESVENVISKKGVIQNPEDVLAYILKLKSYDEIENKAKKVTLFIKFEKYPSISQLPGELEERVFIGGDYESVYLLDAIIAPVVSLKLTPIIAAEFKTTPENIHNDALLLLHNCKYAIFDVSRKGGHMMEAERTLDYGTKTLFVCNKNEQSRVSEMLKSLGTKIDYFESRKELKDIIYNFFGVAPSPPPEQ